MRANGLSQSTLTSLTPNLKIVVVLSSISDGAAVAATNAPTHSRWSRWARFWRRQSPRPGDNPDLLVATWKAAWLSGVPPVPQTGASLAESIFCYIMEPNRVTGLQAAQVGLAALLEGVADAVQRPRIRRAPRPS